jgi:beta-glucosidase
MGFGTKGTEFLNIPAGHAEPSGLLPLQMPASMDAVEAQLEDVPRDMDCRVDSEGNEYDFAYGLNWSGTIDDERTKTYKADSLTASEYLKL